MQINRSNYELWFIDFLDGNLSNTGVKQLLHFLSENPDLKEEFDELSFIRLNPGDNLFTQKGHLKKTYADLSPEQFEFLSIAYLENDLSPEQKDELKEITDSDPEMKRLFNQIQKTRLLPVSLSFKHKNRLKRRTLSQNIVRFSLIGLSSAAIIAFFVINFIALPGEPRVRHNYAAQTIIIDSSVNKTAIETGPGSLNTERKISHTVQHAGNLPYVTQNITSGLKEPDILPPINSDSIQASAGFPPVSAINNIPISSLSDLAVEKISNNLVVLNYIDPVPESDDGRSKLGKFIAKTFREKILKEKNEKDTPLKAYEIAEAGISGLNKILGWEMALDEKKDKNGELKSVYFSSKILKFNAPVKKSEPVQ